ncbi:MAG: TIGR03435 family protein [Terracidiphilus sp.]
MWVQGGTMQDLARSLSLVLRRHVVDETGLTGRYDWELNWTPDLNPSPVVAAPADAEQPADAAPEPSGPSIFTAIQKQLGLQLESQKGPVEVLVIDHVEEPTPN